ncbi:MAG: hypothetical protein AAFN30_01725 [Actinomycetota bacterium]
MRRNSDMLTNDRIRREALRQLDVELASCDDRLPSLRELELAALAEMAATASTSGADPSDDEPSSTDDDVES